MAGIKRIDGGGFCGGFGFKVYGGKEVALYFGLVEDWTATAGHGGRLEEAGGAGRHCRRCCAI